MVHYTLYEQTWCEMKQVGRIITCLVVASVLLFTAYLADRYGHLAENRAYVASGAAATVEAIETALHDAASTIIDVERRNHDDCSPASHRELDVAVYRSLYVKDIITDRDDVTCSAAASGPFLISDFLRNQSRYGNVSGSSSYALSNGGKGKSNTLILSQKNSDGMIAALVSMNAFVSQALGSKVPPESAFRIILDDGSIAGSTPNFPRVIENLDEKFSAHSKVYPFVVEYFVDGSVLANWNYKTSNAIVGLTIIASLIIGWFMARYWILPEKPKHQLARAIATNEFEPHFQPIVDLANGHICGFEALARWPNAPHHLRGPDMFIPQIEGYDLSWALFESLVRQTAISFCKALRENPQLRISFNLTPDDLLRPQFADQLIGLLEDVGLDPKNFTVEITERQRVSSIERMAAVIAQLRRFDIGVSIDDVGTGHNGLSVITALAPTSIKIDKFFLDALAHNDRALPMIELLVTAALNLQMVVVAEGIEQSEQIDVLMHVGVHQAQGYFISRPKPASQAIALLLDHEARFDGKGFLSSAEVSAQQPSPGGQRDRQFQVA